MIDYSKLTTEQMDEAIDRFNEINLSEEERLNKEIHEFLIKYFKKNPELKPDNWEG